MVRLARRLNGPRGSALLALALSAAPFAVAYSPLTYPAFPMPVGIAVISAAVPVTVYGVLWGVSAVLSVAASVTDKRGRQRIKLDLAAWSLFVGLLMIWATGHLIGWVLFITDWPPAKGAENSYLQAGIYYGVSLFVSVCSIWMPCREAEREFRRHLIVRGRLW
jgi:hypothetical protein